MEQHRKSRWFVGNHDASSQIPVMLIKPTLMMVIEHVHDTNGSSGNCEGHHKFYSAGVINFNRVPTSQQWQQLLHHIFSESKKVCKHSPFFSSFCISYFKICQGTLIEIVSFGIPSVQKAMDRLNELEAELSTTQEELQAQTKQCNEVKRVLHHLATSLHRKLQQTPSVSVDLISSLLAS